MKQEEPVSITCNCSCSPADSRGSYVALALTVRAAFGWAGSGLMLGIAGTGEW